MLVEINLLPWRQIRRNEKKKKWMTIIGINFLLIIATCLLGHYGMYQLNYLQNHRIQILRKEMAIVNAQIREIETIKKQREELINQMLFLQKIQNDCYLIIHLFDELTRLIPDNVFLEQMQRKGKKIVLQGIAELNEKIALLMRNINKNPWMENPTLIEVKKRVNSNKKFFNLSFIIKSNRNKELTDD